MLKFLKVNYVEVGSNLYLHRDDTSVISYNEELDTYNYMSTINPSFSFYDLTYSQLRENLGKLDYIPYLYGFDMDGNKDIYKIDSKNRFYIKDKYVGFIKDLKKFLDIFIYGSFISFDEEVLESTIYQNRGFTLIKTSDKYQVTCLFKNIYVKEIRSLNQFNDLNKYLVIDHEG